MGQKMRIQNVYYFNGPTVLVMRRWNFLNECFQMMGLLEGGLFATFVVMLCMRIAIGYGSHENTPTLTIFYFYYFYFIGKMELQ